MSIKDWMFDFRCDVSKMESGRYFSKKRPLPRPILACAVALRRATHVNVTAINEFRYELSEEMYFINPYARTRIQHAKLTIYCLAIRLTKWVKRNTICRWDGHDIIDESYAGPDRGNISLRCRRCGWRHYHTLY